MVSIGVFFFSLNLPLIWIQKLIQVTNFQSKIKIIRLDKPFVNSKLHLQPASAQSNEHDLFAKALTESHYSKTKANDEFVIDFLFSVHSLSLSLSFSFFTLVKCTNNRSEMLNQKCYSLWIHTSHVHFNAFFSSFILSEKLFTSKQNFVHKSFGLCLCVRWCTLHRNLISYTEMRES